MSASYAASTVAAPAVPLKAIVPSLKSLALLQLATESADCSEFARTSAASAPKRAPLIPQAEACQRWVKQLKASLADLSDKCGSLHQEASTLPRHPGGDRGQGGNVASRHQELMGACRRLIAAAEGEDLAILQSSTGLLEQPWHAASRLEDSEAYTYADDDLNASESALMLAALTGGIGAAGASNILSNAVAAAAAASAATSAATSATALQGMAQQSLSPTRDETIEQQGPHADKRWPRIGELEDSCGQVQSLQGRVPNFDDRLRFHDVQGASTASAASRSLPTAKSPTRYDARTSSAHVEGHRLASSLSSTQPGTTTLRSVGGALTVAEGSDLRQNQGPCFSDLGGSGLTTREWQKATSSVSTALASLPCPPSRSQEIQELSGTPTIDTLGVGATSSSNREAATAEDWTSAAISDVWAKHHPSRTGGLMSMWSGAHSPVPFTAPAASMPYAFSSALPRSSTGGVPSLPPSPGSSVVVAPGSGLEAAAAAHWQPPPVQPMAELPFPGTFSAWPAQQFQMISPAMQPHTDGHALDYSHAPLQPWTPHMGMGPAMMAVGFGSLPPIPGPVAQPGSGQWARQGAWVG